MSRHEDSETSPIQENFQGKLAPALQALHQSLQKLLGFHRQLLDVVRVEKECLTNADLKGVQETTFSKEAIISSIKLTENERLAKTAVLATLLKKRMSDLTLNHIILDTQGVEPKLAEQLRSVFNALTILMQRISEQNKENASIAENFLVHVNEMKRNVLGEAAPQAQTYTSHGTKNNPAGGSRLLSQEA